MRLPLSKGEYELLQRSAEGHGLTVDQEAQLALLLYFKKYAPELMEKLEKLADPAVSQRYSEYPL